MKVPIKELFPILLTASVCLFALAAFFYQTSDKSIWNTIGTGLSALSTETAFQPVEIDIHTTLPEDAPSLKYIGGTKKAGTSFPIEELFQLVYPNGQTASLSSDSQVTLYFINAETSLGTGAVEQYTNNEFESLEEITSPLSYNTDNHLLYFHKSGIYKLYVRFYYQNLEGILMEFSLPVEMR